MVSVGVAMTTDSSQYDSFVPVFSTPPEKPEMLAGFTTEQLRIHATGINFREIGWYLDQQIVTGKNFIPGISSANDQQFRTVFRKVIIFGALPDTNTKPMAHGITFDANFTLVDMWASATDPVGFTAITFAYGGTVVYLDMDANNVNITTTSNMTNYTRCYVVIEYMLEQ
jgi:hypothetical protein